ncbi:hypothetical protein GCM10010191_59980 [Actinomadura vinacea]|uniref:histidine kinase n=1 Tax=Actinomadura vinacea TaxID=115336 RepID=A0ABP5WVI8_9ACTN
MVGVDYSAVFEAMPVACAILTPNLEFAATNCAYERLLGRSREQMVGRDAFLTFPEDPAARGTSEIRASLEQVLATGEPDMVTLQRYDIEMPGQPGELQERYWNVVNSPVLGPDGEVKLIVNRVEEVTSFIETLRRAEAHGQETVSVGVKAIEAELFVRARELQDVNLQLRRAQVRERKVAAQLREALLHQQQAVADTSHDLRGPLTGLQTRLQLALSDPEVDSRHVLHAALHDADQLGDIVADLLELARLEADVPILTEPVDLARLVEQNLADHHPSVTVTVRLEPGVVVDGSPVRLSRLLGNLLTNAERHARTYAEVSLASRGGEAVLEVADDGPGIPAAEREAVFQRFYRRADARRSDPEGTGLGLPIARQIAQAHGGTLRIVDQPSGTRMSVRLPLRPTEQAPGEHAPS